jgi:hypothetical protein
MSYILLLAALSLFQPLAVQAHGAMSKITIAGKAYDGAEPFQAGTPTSTTPSPIRQVYGGGPITTITDADNACGIQSQLASVVAPANPGDEIALSWRGTTFESAWPHVYGPMFVYLASCGSQKCSEFDASNAKWFKIAQSGQKSDGTWGQAVLTAGAYTFNLPSNIAPGGYLLRHEVVNLALLDPAEIFPSCAQLEIGGSGTGKPSSSELVSIPGVYQSDAFVQGSTAEMTAIVFGSSDSFKMPAPAIATLSGSGSSTKPTNDGGAGNVEAAPGDTPSSTTKMTKSKSPSSSKTASSTKAGNTAKCSASRKARRSVNASSPVEPVNYSRRHKARFGSHAHARK